MRLLAEQGVDCALCGSERIRDSFQWREFISTPPGIESVGMNVFICDGCGFIFLNPQPDAELLDYYYRTNEKKLIEGPSLYYREQQVEFIASLVKSRGNAFDAGCFDGTFLHYLKEAGWSVSGCDLNEAALEVCRTRYGIETQKGAIDNVVLEDGSIDLLTFVHFLEHVTDPNKVFEWSRRKLAEGGHLYIMVPDAERMFSNSIYGFFSFPHINYFTLVSLKNYLVKHGFDIVSARAKEDFEFIELIARKSGENKEVKLLNDYESASVFMARYAKKWQKGLDDFIGRFVDGKKRWIEKKSKVLLWGAGIHTSKVFSYLPLDDDDLKLIGIIDNDDSIQGGESCGLMVYSPAELGVLKPDVILVSSYWYAEEIGRELREEMNYKGEIFYFYGRPTKGHPIARDY